MLRPDIAFIHPVEEQVSFLKRSEFHTRFQRFLEELTPNPRKLPCEMLDDLFHLAVEAEQQLLAWDKTVSAVKSDEFAKSHEYLLRKSSWFRSIRRMYDRSAPTGPRLGNAFGSMLLMS
jgi:hypothetical protein